MDYFEYRDGKLYADDAPVWEIAEQVGTPFYCYSAKTIKEHYSRISEAFAGLETLVAFSVKAAGNLSIMRMLQDLGSGFDVVSGGELFRAKKVGAEPKKIVFAGVGKTVEEISDALDYGIGLFNVESPAELKRIAKIAAEKGVVATCALRVNPDVDAKTHKKITTGKKENKFGIDVSTSRELMIKYKDVDSVDLSAVHMHIGSQITSVEPYETAVKKIAAFIEDVRAQGCEVNTLNIGGGFGIFYHADEAKTADDFASRIVPIIKETGCRLILEPGRFIMGNAGILVTEVQYVKKAPTKTFVIVDTGMQHLVRPMLYDAFHRIWPVNAPFAEGGEGETEVVDIVGPICESSDVLGKDRDFPAVAQGDLVAVFSAGAYGFTMASNYNAHRRPPEVLAEGGSYRVIRAREKYEDLIRGEEI